MTTTYQHNTRALSREARETIRGSEVTIAGYVRRWFPSGRWGGDTCGCVDDRCIGHHHDPDEECHCLPGWLDEYAAERVRADGSDRNGAPNGAGDSMVGRTAD